MKGTSLSLCILCTLFGAGISCRLSAQEQAEQPFEEFYYRPALSVFYGFSDHNIRDFGATFAKPRLAEIKMGDASETEEYRSEAILRYRYRYGFLTNISTQLGTQAGSGEITSDLWRLGAAWDKGYGYNLGQWAIIPYNSYGIHWSRMNIKDMGSSTSTDSSLLAAYDGNTRFGTKAEGGVKIQLARLISADAVYERAITFPAHLFWKWAGSTVLELGSQELLDRFVRRVMRSSPGAAPVLSFLLKSGLSYGIYELRREKMNYPFDSDPALMTDTFKIGLTFIF